MSKPDDWYPHYVADYAGDTMHLTTVQHGAYRLLMDAYWRNQGPLPDSDEAMASITKMQPKDWRKARPTIAAFFQVGNGRWGHKRIEKELTKAKHNTEQRSKAGKASAEAKKQQKVNGEDNETGNGKSTDVATEPPTDKVRKPDGEANKEATPHTSPSEAAPSGAASALPLDEARALAKRSVAVLHELQAICDTDENRHPAWAVAAPVTAWLQSGADPELDIFPTARAVMARGKRPGSASYLTGAVMDALRQRQAAPAPVASAAIDPVREEAAKQFNAAMDRWIADGRVSKKPELADFLPSEKQRAPDGDLEIPPFMDRRQKATA